MAMGVSTAMENSIRAYSAFLLELPTLTKAEEMEAAEKEIHNTLMQNTPDISKKEAQINSLLLFLADAHTKSLIVGLGWDPFDMTPIVRLDGDEISF
jgi:hypothetical protein